MTLPERADYSLTESALSPFQAEPTQSCVHLSLLYLNDYINNRLSSD